MTASISVDEFLELNEKIGGNDIDGDFVAAARPSETRSR